MYTCMLSLFHAHVPTHVTDSCILYFTQQPITTVDCNVYEADKVLLTCTVTDPVQNDLTSSLRIDIKWYFDNGTKQEVNVGTETTVRNGDEDVVKITSTLALSATSDQNAMHIGGEGFYYCQVQAAITSAMDVRLESNPSQMFQVSSRDFHFQASTSCMERNFIDNVESCAVNQVSTSKV